MQQVGIRELKNRLTHYLGEVKNGENVVVTDRGRPVAILHRLDKIEEDAGLEERLAALAAQGHVRLPTRKGPFKKIKPLELREGEEPVSETLVRDRR
jgi:prevent-host-death family protein